MSAQWSPRTGAAIVVVAGLGAGAFACGAEPLEVRGQFGRPMTLASGDLSPLPRLAFVDQGCPAVAASGGCAATGEGRCQTLLVDSLAPLSALRDADASGSRLAVECLEVRPAFGLAAEAPADADRQAAVARFRFENLPVVRAPDDEMWSWTAGDERQVIEPGGVLGGNLLRNFAVSIRSPRPRSDDDPATLTLFSEFPGSESILADQGRAFIPLQFPGRLLGRELNDRCQVDEGRCEIDGFDVNTSTSEIPLASSRMVLDACLAIPPCGVRYDRSIEDPFGAGTCSLRRGPTSPAPCVEPTDPMLGGLSASLVVATGVSGMVLFSDSATRMFGDVDAMEPCPEPLSPTTEFNGALRACRLSTDGELHAAGWPSAGLEVPLPRIRIRSVALVPGAERSQSIGPCARAAARRDAALLQCDRYQDIARAAGDIRDAAPPYSPQRDDDDGVDHGRDPGAVSLAVLGESTLQAGSSGPRPSRWIRATIIPADHPLAQSVRGDTIPDALQPDGLLGTALFVDTAAVLDYTDLNPAVRLSCLDPHDGRCEVLPDCREDQRPACCHGMPLSLLDEYIRALDDDTCCGALSAEELAELSLAGHCVGVPPP